MSVYQYLTQRKSGELRKKLVSRAGFSTSLVYQDPRSMVDSILKVGFNYTKELKLYLHAYKLYLIHTLDH